MGFATQLFSAEDEQNSNVQLFESRSVSRHRMFRRISWSFLHEGDCTVVWAVRKVDPCCRVHEGTVACDVCLALGPSLDSQVQWINSLFANQYSPVKFGSSMRISVTLFCCLLHFAGRMVQNSCQGHELVFCVNALQSPTAYVDDLSYESLNLQTHAGLLLTWSAECLRVAHRRHLPCGRADWFEGAAWLKHDPIGNEIVAVWSPPMQFRSAMPSCFVPCMLQRSLLCLQIRYEPLHNRKGSLCSLVLSYLCFLQVGIWLQPSGTGVFWTGFCPQSSERLRQKSVIVRTRFHALATRDKCPISPKSPIMDQNQVLHMPLSTSESCGAPDRTPPLFAGQHHFRETIDMQPGML